MWFSAHCAKPLGTSVYAMDSADVEQACEIRVGNIKATIATMRTMNGVNLSVHTGYEYTQTGLVYLSEYLV